MDDNLLPLAALTQCGEHLLSLVQDLESFSSSDALDDLRALVGVADAVLPHSLAWGTQMAQALLKIGKKTLPSVGTGTGSGKEKAAASANLDLDIADVEEGVRQLSRRQGCVACVSVCEKVVFGSFLTDLADYEGDNAADGSGEMQEERAGAANVTGTGGAGTGTGTDSSTTATAADDASDDTASLNFVNQWLGALGDALAGALVVRIVQIKQLSATGRAQLTVDLDYLTNVISAVGLRVHPLLLHIRTLLASPKEAEALLESVLAMPAVKPVAISLKLVDLALAKAMASGRSL